MKPWQKLDTVLWMINEDLITKEEAIKLLNFPSVEQETKGSFVIDKDAIKASTVVCDCGAKKCKTTHTDWCSVSQAFVKVYK